MIGKYPKGNAFFTTNTCKGVIGIVFFTDYFFCCFNSAAKNICIVVALFILQYPYQSFKTHTCIHMPCRQRLQAAIFFSVELNKYIVPYFYYLRMIFVYQRSSGYQGSFIVGPAIHMYFRARATGTCIAHFPKIVFFITENNPVGMYKFLPLRQCNYGGRNIFFFIPFKYGYIQTVFLNTVYICEQFPTPGNGFGFKIIAKAPVAQHLKHGMMIGINAHFFQVVVFATYPQAFLCIDCSFKRRSFIAQKIIFKLVHPCIGKQ